MQEWSNKYLPYSPVFSDGEAAHDRDLANMLGTLNLINVSTNFTPNTMKPRGILPKYPKVLRSPDQTSYTMAVFGWPSEVTRVALIGRYTALAPMVPIVNGFGLQCRNTQANACSSSVQTCRVIR